MGVRPLPAKRLVPDSQLRRETRGGVPYYVGQPALVRREHGPATAPDGVDAALMLGLVIGVPVCACVVVALFLLAWWAL
jgi:hypothetical protein